VWLYFPGLSKTLLAAVVGAFDFARDVFGGVRVAANETLGEGGGLH